MIFDNHLTYALKYGKIFLYIFIHIITTYYHYLLKEKK